MGHSAKIIYSITTLYHDAQCRVLFIIILNVIVLPVMLYLLLCSMSLSCLSCFIYYDAECIMLSAIVLNVIMLSAAMLSVVAPFRQMFDY
jgi:hypothetical protein